MPTAKQAATVPGEFLDRMTRWAQRQSTPVSVILFGSRARGDCGPESDWDIALVYEGKRPSLDGLPRLIDDRAVDWARIDRSHALRRLNVCGVPHAVATDGRCLLGDPLPLPERQGVNVPAAWKFLFEGHREMHSGIHELANYWSRPSFRRWGYDTGVAHRSAMAAELLCKAALSLRGVEPRRFHSVADLCEDLAREAPADPLLPALRKCDGLTAEAHVAMYPGRKGPQEEIGVSARRLTGVLHASGEVLAAACEISFAEEGKVLLEELAARRNELLGDLERLESSDCPREMRQFVQAGVDAGPDPSELRYSLVALPVGRSPRQEGPQKAAAEGQIGSSEGPQAGIDADRGTTGDHSGRFARAGHQLGPPAARPRLRDPLRIAGSGGLRPRVRLGHRPRY